MFAGSPFGASYFGQGPVRSTPLAVLLVEIATVFSLNPARRVSGSVDYRLHSGSIGRTVQSLDDQRVRSSSPVRTVEGIP